MPLFQSSTAKVTVFQNGIELFGDCITAVIHDWLVECDHGRVTIRIENLTDKEFKASIVRRRLVPVGPGASHDFHLDVEYRAVVEIRWKRTNIVFINFLVTE